MTNKASLVALLLTACVTAPDDKVSLDTDQPDSPATADEPVEGSFVTTSVDLLGVRQTATYQVVHGHAILEGDIDLGDADEVAARALDRAEIIDGNYRWANATIPYVIDPGHPKAAQIQAAIQAWQQQSLFTFVPRTTQTDYIDFESDPTLGYSWSRLGHIGGAQPIVISNGADTAVVIHEIGHALGLMHEQTRGDHSNYIVINTANIDPNQLSQFQHQADGEDLFGFDFKSIMLYDSYAFSINGKPTMTRLDGTTWVRNLTLSQEDLQAAALLAVPYNATKLDLELYQTGKCVTGNPDYVHVATAVYAWDCADAWPQQKWYRFTVPGSNDQRLINAYTGLCLAEQNANGAWVTQQLCQTSNAQEAFLTKSEATYYQSWRPDGQTYCIAGTPTNGANLTEATCSDPSTQQMFWTFNY